MTGQAPLPEEAASVADERLRALEAALAQLQQEGRAAQTRAVTLERQLAANSQASRAQPWLIGALLAALALAGGLFWRLRREQKLALAAAAWWQRPQSDALDADASEGSAPEAVPPAWPPSISDGVLVASGMTPLDDWALPVSGSSRTAATPAVAFSGAAVDIDLDEPAPAAAKPFNPLGTMPLDPFSAPAREVSVEELLDLEQQADFFIALGQEDAAVDLLMAYLRSTGGLSPLPYTKLLEIYRRQGDRSAYERIRARFNRRFNAYAPDWEQGPQAGRSLEDYPEAVLQMQAVWSTPLDAMATLEAMLFRRDETRDLFDLPAYQDVLLMYSIARDLWGQADQSAAQVDLLLPLGEGQPATGAAMPADALPTQRVRQVVSTPDPEPGDDVARFELAHELSLSMPLSAGDPTRRGR